MTYGAGLPIMMFMTSLAFTIYFNVDKLLLMRYYAKPPKMGDAIMEVVVKMLPWAGAIRLAVGCWMYSNDTIFPYSKLNIGKGSESSSCPPSHLLFLNSCTADLPNYSLFDSVKISNAYNSWVENHVGVEYFFINTGEGHSCVSSDTNSSTLGSRIPRGNVFPLFVFLVIVLVILLVTQLYPSPRLPPLR
jgi:hypothetical protein